MHILFVCTGNTCRSPMAAALLRHHATEAQFPVEVESAGLCAWPGQPMSAHAADALIRRHVVLAPHQSQPITPALLQKADWILTMTQSHKMQLQAQYPEYADKVVTLLGFVDEAGIEADIDDPFGCNADDYEACADVLDKAVQRLLAKLQGR